MSTTERLYRWLNDATFDPEKGCRHPQDVIAAALECSERTVIRCTQQLERQGRIRVDRPCRRGVCNTYWVGVWNPSKRADVLRVLDRNRRAVFEARKRRRFASCHPKRPATSFRDQPRGTEHSSNVVDQRCGRERNRIERSRGVPEPARVPDLRVVGCPECERYRKALDAMQVDLENAETSLRLERRRRNEALAQARNLKQDRERAAKETPNIELIERLWEFWRDRVRPGSRKMDLKTIEAVRARLGDRVPESDEPAYSPRYIAEAIVGAQHEAYVNPRTGERYDRLELICRTPENLEKFHDRYERHCSRFHRSVCVSENGR